MTNSAQQALRRTLEIFSGTTRFALTCNNSSKIIEPIQSRCAVIRFMKLSDPDIYKRLLRVAHEESIQYNESGMEALVFTADGDMRQALNNMQSTCAGFSYVTADNVFKVCDQPHPLVVRQIIECCAACDIDAAHEGLQAFWKQGYSAWDVIGTFYRVVKNMGPGGGGGGAGSSSPSSNSNSNSSATATLSEPMQLDFIKEIGFVHARVISGLATLLQLSALLAKLCDVAASYKNSTHKW